MKVEARQRVLIDKEHSRKRAKWANMLSKTALNRQVFGVSVETCFASASHDFTSRDFPGNCLPLAPLTFSLSRTSAELNFLVPNACPPFCAKIWRDIEGVFWACFPQLHYYSPASCQVSPFGPFRWDVGALSCHPRFWRLADLEAGSRLVDVGNLRVKFPNETTLWTKCCCCCCCCSIFFWQDSKGNMRVIADVGKEYSNILMIWLQSLL